MKIRKNKKSVFDGCKEAVLKHLDDFAKALEEASENEDNNDDVIYRMTFDFYNQSLGYSFALLECKIIKYEEALELQKISLKWLIDQTSDEDNSYCDYVATHHSCSDCPYQLEDWQKQFDAGGGFTYSSIYLFLLFLN